jgi:hypothetical protein
MKMRKIYPEFIENAHRDNFTNFANIGKDRWDTFEIDGYRKLSNVLKKSKKTSWERLYVYYTDLYIMIQFLANYDEKYELVENLNKETLTKLMEDNLDNPYINWDRIYYHFEDKYKYLHKFGYLDRWDTIVLSVLFKFSRRLNQENDFW